VHELFATREPAAQDPAARPTSPTPSLTSTTMAPDTDRRENQREKRHRPIRAQTLNPDKSHGRPKDKHGLEAHRRKRPTRLRSPKKAPVPDDRTLGPDPDGPSKTHFHAATRKTRRTSARSPKRSSAARRHRGGIRSRRPQRLAQGWARIRARAHTAASGLGPRALIERSVGGRVSGVPYTASVLARHRRGFPQVLADDE
jgi:hypothetical protein